MPPSRQIREDFVDWPVGNVFVHTVAALPEREGDLVAHAEQLGKAQHALLKFKESGKKWQTLKQSVSHRITK